MIRRCVLGVAALFMLAACGGAADAAGDDDDRFVVVTTTNFVTDTVANIGGDDISVTGLMGAGVDPHLYRPRSGDLERLRQADLVVAVGLHLEGRLAEVLTELGDNADGPRVVFAGEVIPEGLLLAADENVPDPHVWHDPALWALATQEIGEAIIEADPDHADAHRARLTGYLAEIDELDTEMRDAVASIPEDRRILVTSHDAFRYLGEAYDIEVIGLQGISTMAEVTVGALDDAATVVTERNVPTVFVESSVPSRTMEALIDAARRNGVEVSMGPELFSDAAGDAGTVEGTYLGMMSANAERIAGGLR